MRRFIANHCRAAAMLAVCLSVAFAGPTFVAHLHSSDSLRLLVEPKAGLGEIDEILRSARHSVELEMYELQDPVAESILAADAARGVDVRVILNEHYTEKENEPAYEYLTSHGVHVHWASTRFDLTHEKAAVIDNATALVMTMNLTAEYYSTTRDVVVIDTQPADVRAIAATFNGDWNGGEASPPTGVDLLWSPGSESALVGLIGSARHSIYIENEEMDEPYIEAALESAARRGVRVTVVMTAESDWDSAFSELAEAGVDVRTYPDSYDALYIHAKVVDIDPGYADERVFVGSENFSEASLLYNRELGIVTSNPTIVDGLFTVVRSDADGGSPWH